MIDQVLSFWKYYNEVLTLNKGKKVDFVFASSSRLFTAFLGYRIAKKTQAPLYLDIRDIFVDTMNDVFKSKFLKILILPVLKLIESKTFNYAKHINLISGGFKEYFNKYNKSSFTFYSNGIDDEFPLWPDGLAYSQIGRELIDAIRSGETAEQWKKRKHLSGGLPLGALAKEVWVKVEGEVSAMIAAGAEALTQKPTQVPVSLTIDDKELASVGQGKLRVRDIISTHGHIILEVNYATWSRRMRVMPWLQMAALTLHNPDVKWKAVIVAKAPKVESKAKEPAPQALFALEEFVIAGETPEERSVAAQRVLDFGNTIRNRARIVPVPLFERSSWIIDKSASDQKAELGYDLQRPSHALIFGSQDLDDFKSDPLIEGIDIDLPVGSSRYEAYATLLSTVWKETVRVTKEAEPPKKRSAGTKGKTKKSVDNEEAEVEG
jgi:hypothetical protein